MHNCFNSQKLISECAAELSYVLKYPKQMGVTISSSIKQLFIVISYDAM
jgi:hypothetical protein